MKSFGLNLFVVFPSSTLLGSQFINLGLVSDFLDKIEADSLLFIIGVFPKMLSPGAGFFNLDRDHGL